MPQTSHADNNMNKTSSTSAASVKPNAILQHSPYNDNSNITLIETQLLEVKPQSITTSHFTKVPIRTKYLKEPNTNSSHKHQHEQIS